MPTVSKELMLMQTYVGHDRPLSPIGSDDAGFCPEGAANSRLEEVTNLSIVTAKSKLRGASTSSASRRVRGRRWHVARVAAAASAVVLATEWLPHASQDMNWLCKSSSASACSREAPRTQCGAQPPRLLRGHSLAGHPLPAPAPIAHISKRCAPAGGRSRSFPCLASAKGSETEALDAVETSTPASFRETLRQRWSQVARSIIALPLAFTRQFTNGSVREENAQHVASGESARHSVTAGSLMDNDDILAAASLVQTLQPTDQGERPSKYNVAQGNSQFDDILFPPSVKSAAKPQVPDATEETQAHVDRTIAQPASDGRNRKLMLPLPRVSGLPGRLGLPIILASLSTGIIIGISVMFFLDRVLGEDVSAVREEKKIVQQLEQKIEKHASMAWQQERDVLQEKVNRDSTELLREVTLQDQLKHLSGVLSDVSVRLETLRESSAVEAATQSVVLADSLSLTEDPYTNNQPPPGAGMRYSMASDTASEAETWKLLDSMSQVLPLLKTFVDESVNDLDVKMDQLSETVSQNARTLRRWDPVEEPVVPLQEMASQSPEEEWPWNIVSQIRFPRGVVEYASGVLSGGTGATMLGALALLSIPLVRRRQQGSAQQPAKKGRWQALLGGVGGFVRGGFDAFRSKLFQEPPAEAVEVSSSLGGVRAPPVSQEPALQAIGSEPSEFAISVSGPEHFLDETGAEDASGYIDYDDFEVTFRAEPLDGEPKPMPPLAVGAEEICIHRLERAGTALRVFSRWAGHDGSVSEWTPLVAVAVENPQALVVRALWAARSAPGVEMALTKIVSGSVNARVQKRGWQGLVIGAQTSTRTLDFGYEVLTWEGASQGDQLDNASDLSERDIVHIPGRYIVSLTEA